MAKRQYQIDQDRLASVSKLLSGGHSENDDGNMCAMEAVAYIAREPWSDHPRCACQVIAAFMRSWNDGLPDGERTTLILPLLPKLVGTRGSKAIERRRATMAADWLIRTHTVAWLRLAKLDAQADALASLPEITDFAQCPSLMPTLNAVSTDAAGDAARAAAWDAAGDAAWAAARAAAGDAARAAAWDAAGDAAWDAAWDAAGDAAWAAARAAAGAAARAAAWDALSKTKSELQQSAVALVERMCAATDKASEAA